MYDLVINYKMVYADPEAGNQSKDYSDAGITDFISDYAQMYIDIYLISVGCTLIGVFGMLSNVINFFVLTRHSVKDCVSVCLLSLTFSDFFVAACMFTASICYSYGISDRISYVDTLALSSIVSWTWGMIFDISMLTTAFISVERCLTVLFPFKFKDLVTFKRALVCLYLIYTVTASGYIASFMTQGLSAQFDFKTNSTRLNLWISNNKEEVEAYTNISIHVVYGTLCEIVVIFSTCGMISGLRRSCQFRSAYTKIDSSSANALSQKNKKIVKMVSVLAGIFVVCNLARLSYNYVLLAFPEFSIGKRLHNSFSTFLRIMLLCDTTGASVNIIVYFLYKPRFKRSFLSFFRCVSPKHD